MDALTVKHRIAALAATLLCAAPAVVFAQLAGSERTHANQAQTSEEPSLSRPETWLKRRAPTHAPLESSIKADSVAPPKTDSATLPYAEATSGARGAVATPPKTDVGNAAKPDGNVIPLEPETSTREADGERAVPRGAREAARDPCLRSSDPKCYERHKERYHPYLGYTPGSTQWSTPSDGATSASAAGGLVGATVAPASATVTPTPAAVTGKLEQPLIFFDPPPKKRRGK